MSHSICEKNFKKKQGLNVFILYESHKLDFIVDEIIDVQKTWTVVNGYENYSTFYLYNSKLNPVTNTALNS